MYSMHFDGIRKWMAIAAAVSCVMGTGAFPAFGESAAEVAQESAAAVRDKDRQGDQALPDAETEDDRVSISWWICPAGDYASEEKVQALVDAFEQKNPKIDVDFRILDERGGENVIDTVLTGTGSAEGNSSRDGAAPVDGSSADGDGGQDEAASAAPDVVLAAPEYIVTKWGNDGLMADLSELWDEETMSEFRSEMRDASKNRNGVWYAVPLYRDLYSMAFNYEMFRKAGVLQYLNEEVHSWKDSGFIDSVLRIHDVLVQEAEEEAAAQEDGAESGSDKKDDSKEDADEDGVGVVGRVYCRDEVGQRAFMCFVTNFLNTGLVDDFHSSYQMGKGKIRNVFGTLRNLVGKGIEFDPEMNGEDENEAFLSGEVFLTFNWSASKQRAMAKDSEFTIFPMMYPNAKNTPHLTGPIGSLGVVDTKDQEKKDAAVSFVRYLMTDEDAYTQAVLTSGCFPARLRINGRDLAGLYGNDETMRLYETLNEYYSDYEPVMELYLQLDRAWPEMIRAIGNGEKIKTVTTQLAEELNTQLREQYGIQEIEADEEEE